MAAMMGVTDLEKHFAFYGAYHSNKINVLFHTIFVWPIFFTGLVLGSFTPAIVLLPLPPGTFPFQECIVLNLSFVTAAVYALFYVMLDKKAGTIAGALCLLCWVSSNALAQRLGFSLAWKVVLVSQLVCWTGQFIGHGIFEALQKFYNYEPYPGFKKSVRAKVQANISEWRMKKQKKSA